jgi:hypothetical protein
MKKTDLETFFDSLLPNLWEELIFFIPDRNIPKDIMDKTTNFKLKKFLNKVLVMDTYEGPIEYKEGRNNNKTLLKASKLESNLYQLLEKEKATSSLEFNFILEKYREQIECLKYISEWMYLNLNQVEKFDQTVKGLFQIQLSYYKKHSNVFLNQFYKNRTDYNKIKFNLESIIKSQLKEIVEKKENHTKKEETQSAQNISLNNNTPQKVKKQPLVTYQEAEKHLLKKVFNLDLKVIN